MSGFPAKSDSCKLPVKWGKRMARLRRSFSTALFILAFWAAAQNAAAQEPPTSCEKPDENLLKSRGAYSGRAQLPDAARIDLYNAQGRRFNECTRNLIGGNNAQIDRVRDDANDRIRRIADSANTEIAGVTAKMRAAATGASSPASAQTSFPEPQCVKPDISLLKPNKRDPKGATARGERYLQQEENREACMRDYADRASAETRRIAAAANAQIRRIADDANSRIAALAATVRGGIQTAASVALIRSQMVEGTPLAATDPVLQARSAANPLENSQGDRALWPVVQNTPTGEGVARAITCRAPQRLADSQLLGPQVCKRNGVWAALRRAGKDIGPDGRTVVKYDVTRKAACIEGALCN